MASYQIPQFLDSGDKILGPLNMRQFGYALAGFFICVLVFTVTQSTIPGIGNYALVPCIPIVGITAYLALGRYNGRDSEIYVLKYILYALKPRQMVYTRVPETTDLDEKLGQLTADNIQKEWNARVAKQKQIETNNYTDFNTQETTLRAKRIRELGYNLDTSLYNTLTAVQRRELEIKAKESLLMAQSGKQPTNQPQFGPTPQPFTPPQDYTQKNPDENFFTTQAK
jgi:hypothetical protein